MQNKNTRLVYPRLLATIFSSSFIEKIIQNRHINDLRSIYKQTGFDLSLMQKDTVEDALGRTFDYMKNHYRCEYVYKSAILNQLLRERHPNNLAFLTEFKVLNAKVDFLFLNGSSTAYEIKSDLDNLDRLPAQLAAYQKVFDKVFVVTNDLNKTVLKKEIPKQIGILVINKDLSVSNIREAKSNLKTIDKSVMFDSLRKPEYLSIIKLAYGDIPKVPGTLIHGNCKRLFVQLNNKVAHNLFIKVLKKRQIVENQRSVLLKMPLPLRCVLVEKKYSILDIEMVKFGLSRKIFS